MSTILSVDPGIRGSGVAFFHDGALVSAAYLRNPCLSGNGPTACVRMALAVGEWVAGVFGHVLMVPALTFVCEWPQVYTQGLLKGDPNDLLPLAGVDCAIAARLYPAPFVHYLPKDWKGQIPKGELYEQRILKRLSESEIRAIRDDGRLTHNTYDAIGIGLHHLGRFKPRKVIAR